jgi:L-phenylalanine/L-methionine N-acetyltransferase
MTNVDIVIRAVEPEDYQAFHDIHSQPKVIWGTAQPPYSSASKWRERLSALPENVHGFVAEIDGRVIGSASVVVETSSMRRKHAGTLGMAVHDDFQGMGVGRLLMSSCLQLADEWLNLRRVDLRVYADNHSAIALYRQFGFEVEGTLKCHSFRGGNYIDAHMMARLNHD